MENTGILRIPAGIGNLGKMEMRLMMLRKHV
jgi:hypothetical protein